MNASIKFIVILIFSLVTHLSYADNRISLLKITGKVQISSDMKSWIDVTKPQKIKNKTWLKTGKSGSVVLVLPDRTQTKVTRNSKLFLEKKSKKKQTINLKLGKIWAKTNKIPVKISLKSPNAVASIRGTEWVSEVKADGSSVIALLEGKVSIASNNNKNIDLKSGSVANIDKKGSISQTKIINTGKYLQFLYNYQIEPYAYIPKKELSIFIKNKISSNETGLGRGEFYVNKEQLPNEVLNILEYINKNQISELISYLDLIKIRNGWKSWFNYIKAETLIINGNTDDFKIFSKRLPDDFRTIYIWAKYNISQGELKKAKELLLSIPDEKRLSFHNFQLGKIHKIMGLNEKAENYFKKSHKQAKLWVKPIVELASIAMSNSRFDYARHLLKQAEEFPNKSLEYKSIAMQFYTLRNQIRKASDLLSSIPSNDLNFSAITDAGVIELKKGT